MGQTRIWIIYIPSPRLHPEQEPSANIVLSCAIQTDNRISRSAANEDKAGQARRSCIVEPDQARIGLTVITSPSVKQSTKRILCHEHEKTLVSIFLVLIPYQIGREASAWEIGAMPYASMTQVTWVMPD